MRVNSTRNTHERQPNEIKKYPNERKVKGEIDETCISKSVNNNHKLRILYTYVERHT